MNKKQSNYVSMTKATLAVMEIKRAEWETIDPVNETVTKVTEHLNTLETEDREREGMKTKGLTKDKDNVYDTMCYLAYKMTSRIKAYAKRNNNNVLLAEVDFTESSLKAGTQQAVFVRCQAILEKAKDHAEDLTNYLVTAENITALENAINAYEPLTSERDAVGDERVAKTGILNAEIGNIRTQLDILDDLVEGLFDDEFIDAYHSARNIIDR